jgi:hypothetical protein
LAQDIIRIRCPNLVCGRVLVMPVTARGRKVKCRECATIMTVPTIKAASQPNSAANGEQKNNAA